MREKRWLAVFVTMLLCVSLVGMTASAALELPRNQEIQVFDLNAKKAVIQPRGTYLATGGCGVTVVGDGVVQFTGETNCYRTADTVSVTVSLDQLSGNGYTYDTSSNTAYGTYYVSTAKTIAVPRGYYYYARSSHYVQKGSTVETTSSSSHAVYVG